MLDAELQNKRRFMKGKVTSRAYEQLTAQEIRDLKLVFDVFDTDKSGLVSIGNEHIVPGCAVPDKIPTHPMEGHQKFLGGGGSQKGKL